MPPLQTLALQLFRALGGFALVRHLTRDRLRILCYHGFSLGDEHEVAPMMFMRAETFERRMRILRRRRIPVVTLEEGVRRLTQHEVRHAETVITFDDGWASNLAIGVPIAEKFGYPVSIYLTTEHLGASPEVFNVALAYMIRRSGKSMLTLAGVHPQIDGSYDLRTDPEAAIRAVITAVQKVLPLPERRKLLRPIATALGLDLEEVLKNGRFNLLTGSQIQELFSRGVDIQLHTHSHRLPEEFEAAAGEIGRNRQALRELTGAEPRHFCYPSGIYHEQHPEWLARLGIISATTCDPGFNDRDTSPLLLKRYLDSERISDLAFEAEICGVRELARNVRAALARVRNSRSAMTRRLRRGAAPP
ncbi:MAG TPA: polysaccharide deacetylase family protein [Steroidobacteraceae bacterium]|nr:polysaccharide deacetylase family protein [Steroidobacteraceae bacterium]